MTGALVVAGASPDEALWGAGCVPALGDPVAAPQQVTAGLVLRALRRVELPKPVLVVQPPGGRTLVNLGTIFSTEAPPLRRSVRLLGKRVELDIEAVSFRWVHGDGSDQRTTGPGLAYRRGAAQSRYITHAYVKVATVRPRVAVSYGARFRVDGGRWREVDGAVTVMGPPVVVRVVEAEPVLVVPPD